ncbi:MAG: hypothetical protein U0457_01475 [Candidatus Sericytochromatia bacterium]
MKKLLYSFTAIFLVFLLIFNNNSICYANESNQNWKYYEPSKTEEILIAKLDTEITFDKEEHIDLLSNQSKEEKSNIIMIPIKKPFLEKDKNSPFMSANENNYYKNDIFSSNHLFQAYAITIVLNPVILAFIPVIINNKINDKFITSIASSIIFILINSFSVYNKKNFEKTLYLGAIRNKKEKLSFGHIFAGTLLGIISYFLVLIPSIIFESLFSLEGKGVITTIQDILFIFLMPLFSTIGATIGGDIGKEKVNFEKNNENLEQTSFKEFEKNNLEFFNNIKISNGNISFNLLTF